MSACGSDDEEPEEFDTFDEVLKILPACQGLFFHGCNNSQQTLRLPRDWKKCIITELDVHLPTAIVKGDEEPRASFFHCRKSVYKQCLSTVKFSRKVEEIMGLLEGINFSLFHLVEQHPRNESINGVSALFILARKFVQFVAWDQFEKQTGDKVKKCIDQMLKDLKAFRRESKRLQNAVEDFETATRKVFKHGPHPNADLLLPLRRSRLPCNQDGATKRKGK